MDEEEPLPPRRLVEYFIVVSCKRDIPQTPSPDRHSVRSENNQSNIPRRLNAEDIPLDTVQDDSETCNISATGDTESTRDFHVLNTENISDHEMSVEEHTTQPPYNKEEECVEDMSEEDRLLRRFNMRVVHLPPDDDGDDDEDEFSNGRIQEEADPILYEITHSPSKTKRHDDVVFTSSTTESENRADPHDCCIPKLNPDDSCLADCERSYSLTPTTREILPNLSLDPATDSPGRRMKSKNASYYFSSRRVPVISDFDLVMQPFQTDPDIKMSFSSIVEDEDKADDSSLSSDPSKSLPSHTKSHDSIDTAEAQSQIDACGILREPPMISPPKALLGGHPSENIQLPGNTPLRASTNTACYRPVITARYPLVDHSDNPLNSMVTQFIFPSSTSMELTTEYRLPRIHSFVLTNEKGQKIYGTCLTVMEEYSPDPDHLFDYPIAALFTEGNPDPASTNDNVELLIQSPSNHHVKYYLPKAICILSSWPYLQAFGQYITSLYQLATMTNAMNTPLERFILNICEEVPVPYPGAFEVQLKIFQSTIRFWAPPANLPIAYVALPYRVLFECLDVDNVIFVWYALTLERKILLVSTQYSLLTLCAEILCSLLFPMRWNHLYVPILPRFLSPMLDAPMPYLCGITRDNFLHSVRNINEETIVVDLDRNVITMRENTPDLPPIPLSRRSKLEAVLEEIASPVFWAARGLSPSNVEILKSQKDLYTIQRLTESAEIVWKKKLRSYDHAFSIADIPDDQYDPVDDDDDAVANAEDTKNQWDIVQDSFLRFFVSMLKDYRNFLSVPHQVNERDRWKTIRTFHSEQFIEAQRSDLRPFLKEFCSTQLFDDFITRRVASHADELDMIFFDQSITAKLNRSKMTLKKKKTPFLKHAKAHKRLRVVEAVQPNPDYLPSDFEHKDPCYPGFSNWHNSFFSYPSWPEAFNDAYFCAPRMIPQLLSQFDRKTSVIFKPLDGDNGNNGVQVDAVTVSSSLEAVSFTLFFIIFSDTIGRTDSSFNFTNASTKEANTTTSDEIDVASKHDSENPSVDFLCNCDSFSVLFCDEWNMKDMFDWIWGMNDAPGNVEGSHINANAANISQDVADKMTLVYSIIDTLKMRKVKIELESLRSLLKAVTRCGNRSLIVQLFEALQTRGIKMNEDMYLTFKDASPSIDPTDPMIISSSTGSMDSSSQNQSNSFDVNCSFNQSDNDNVAKSWIGRYSLSQSISSSLGRKPHTLTRKDKLLVTDEVAQKLVEGKHLSLDFYGDLEINTTDICPQCSLHITEDELMLGWNTCDYNDCTTHCPKCSYRFVACFVVKSTNAEFIGSQGQNTPLYCEFISPWVLKRELSAIIEKEPNGACAMLHPEWRHRSYYNATIWWNLIVTFERQKIPYSFMLYSKQKGLVS